MLRLTRLARFARLAKLSKLTNLRKLGAIIMRFLQNVGVSRMGLEFVFTMGTCELMPATFQFQKVSFRADDEIRHSVAHVIVCLFAVCFILLATMHILGCLFLNIGRGHAAESEGWLLYAYGEDAEVYGNATHQDMYINALYFMIVRPPRPPSSHVHVCAGLIMLHGWGWCGAQVTMSSTGYGDLLPKTPGEKVYLIFVIFVGSFVYAYIIGSFSTTLSHMSSDRNAFEVRNATLRFASEVMQATELGALPPSRRRLSFY